MDEKKNQQNPNNSSKGNSPQQGHGKNILIGIGIFSVVILVSILTIRKRRKSH